MCENIQVFLTNSGPNLDVKLKKSIFLDFQIFYPPNFAGLWFDLKIFSTSIYLGQRSNITLAHFSRFWPPPASAKSAWV